MSLITFSKSKFIENGKGRPQGSTNCWICHCLPFKSILYRGCLNKYIYDNIKRLVNVLKGNKNLSLETVNSEFPNSEEFCLISRFWGDPVPYYTCRRKEGRNLRLCEEKRLGEANQHCCLTLWYWLFLPESLLQK